MVLFTSAMSISPNASRRTAGSNAQHPDYTCVCLVLTHCTATTRATQGGTFLFFVLGGKGNLSGKDCVEQETLMAREPFLSFGACEFGHSGQSSTPEQLIMITFLCATNIKAEPYLLLAIHLTTQTNTEHRSARAEWQDLKHGSLYTAPHICLAKVYTLPKLTPHPAATNPLL